MTEDLVAWLLDQIDDDERMAQDEVEARARWQAEYAVAGPIGIVVNPFDEPGSPGDPARVLAECDAKRRRIGLIAHEIEEGRRAWHELGEEFVKLLKLEGLPYAGREGYREEWKP